MGWLTKLTSANSKDPGTKNSRVFHLVLLGNEVLLKHFKKQANGRTGHMKSVAITQMVRLLGRVLTLSYPLAIEGILKHTAAEARPLCGA
jgi:hypothetical protein